MSLSAVVAFGHYGEVGSLNLFYEFFIVDHAGFRLEDKRILNVQSSMNSGCGSLKPS
jgi:hypothetical protein